MEETAQYSEKKLKGHWGKDISKDEFILSESRVGRGREASKGGLGEFLRQQVTGDSLYPEYTGYSSHQEFMSPFESRLSRELLFPKNAKGVTMPLWGLESWRPESSHLSPPWSPNHF